jgi:hypothetical protein
MAYVVGRPRGRFEVRESVHTPKGPRARTLAGFRELTDEVLAKGRGRAVRPFDAAAVIASAEAAGAPVRVRAGAGSRNGRVGSRNGHGGAAARFVGASGRMARSVGRRSAEAGGVRDPGGELIELLGFADAVRRSLPPRGPERLAFPSLSRLLEGRSAAAAR